jgi:pyruvate/2-oxoglutarate dehydrogenase complex dihydrolipoamide dehydrogenase (E3) component
MLVIGAGAGGLVTAAGSAGLGAKVAIIERAFMGGDCLNTGCVPSKAMLQSARIAHYLRTSSEYGINIKGGSSSIEVDFPKVMERMRKIRAEISEGDSV